MDTSGVIRKLGAFERDRIQDHLLRLGEQDRHLRFGGHASPERVISHCAGLDLARVVVVGFMVAGEARGIGELRPLPGTLPRAAEVRWIRRLHMLCLLDNGRMVRLARRFDSRLSFDQGQIEASIELPWPTGWTVLEEIGGELQAWWATPPGGAWPACGARSRRARACAGGPSAA
jgi:hypothetical protein